MDPLQLMRFLNEIIQCLPDILVTSFSHSIHSKVLSETQANIFVDCAESLCNGSEHFSKYFNPYQSISILHCLVLNNLDPFISLNSFYLKPYPLFKNISNLFYSHMLKKY